MEWNDLLTFEVIPNVDLAAANSMILSLNIVALLNSQSIGGSPMLERVKPVKKIHVLLFY